MLAKNCAMLLGAFLLVAGIWGFISPMPFGIFTTNTLHAIIEIVLGILGLLAGMRGGSATWLLVVGAILVIVGAMRFIGPLANIVIDLLNVNVALATFNIIVGVIAIAIGASARRGIGMPGRGALSSLHLGGRDVGSPRK
jgi:hypothetical protein